MALDETKNFAKVTVSTGYDSDDVTIVLASGDGSKLPSTAPYNLVWWNVTDYPDPCDDPNREIVRVTARTTDTLTVTRGQEGTSGATHNTASKVYKMIRALTALDWAALLKVNGLFKSAFDVKKTADQSIAGGAGPGLLTKAEFNSENFDTNSEFDPTTNYRFTAKTAGIYHVSASVRLSNLIDGSIYEMHVRKNGSTFVLTDRQTAKGTDNVLKNSKILQLAVNDYLEVWVWNPATTGTITLNYDTGMGTFFCGHNVYDGVS